MAINLKRYDNVEFNILYFLTSSAYNDAFSDLPLQVSTKVTVNDILHGTKAALSFNIPDHKSGKVGIM